MHNTTMRKKTILSLAAIVAITGCTQGVKNNSSDGSFYERNKRAIGGAIAGVIGGGVIGHQSDHKKEGAIIGGLAGLGIGAYMDKQAAELQTELGGSGVQVGRNGNDIVLNMPENITFDTGKSSLKPRFYGTLNDVAQVVAKYNETRLSIAGHTDNVGSDSYNQTLSQQRAANVRSYLAAQGVNTGRLNSYGYGESRPVASNQTNAGRAQNRRVEITITPSQ
jgi:outer membrane protein OmpA-like peptidoglycan-associated protein